MIEYGIVGLAIAFAINRYFDNYFLHLLLANQKLMETTALIVTGIILFFIIKYYPENTRYLITHSRQYKNLLPESTQHVFDFAERHFGRDELGNVYPATMDSMATTFIHKRAVSASMKKKVASDQQWRCAICQSLLPATYEIDHKVRLEYGGSNEYSNLQALCRNCHGTKTMNEARV